MTDDNGSTPHTLRWTWAIRDEEGFSKPHVTFLALLLASRADEKNRVWCTRDWLVRKTGQSLSTVKRDLAELKRTGYIVGTNTGGRGKASEYLLTIPERGSERGSQRGSERGSEEPPLKGFTPEPPRATTGATATSLQENGSRNGATAVPENSLQDDPSRDSVGTSPAQDVPSQPLQSALTALESSDARLTRIEELEHEASFFADEEDPASRARVEACDAEIARLKEQIAKAEAEGDFDLASVLATRPGRW